MALCFSVCTDTQLQDQERAAMATYTLNLGLGHMESGNLRRPTMYTVT